MTTLEVTVPALALAGGLDRNQALQRLKDFLQREKAQTFQLHQQGASGRLVVARLARLVDTAINFAHTYALENTPPPAPLAWIATGGYGRGELNPFSDISLLLFHQDAPADSVERLAGSATSLLAEAGLTVSLSCRTPQACLKAMEGDPLAACALLEGRWVAGEENLFQSFEKEVLAAFFSRHWFSFLRDRIEEQQARHGAKGASPYLVESNLMSSPGGLRDIHLLFWTKRLAEALPTRRELIPSLKEKEYPGLLEAHDLLLRLRTQLHLLSNKKYDLFDRSLHEPAASAFGYKQEDGLPAATGLMRDYFRTAARVCHLTRGIQSRFEDLKPSSQRATFFRRPLGSDFVAMGKRLYFAKPAEPLDAHWKLLETFLVAQRHHLELCQQVLEHVRENLRLVDDGLRSDPQAARCFLSILEGTGSVAPVLRQMRDCGLLGAFLPEFEPLVGFVHYESLPTYTVDEQTLLALAVIDEVWLAESGATAQKRRLLEETGHHALLRLALLLHDIGKPRGPGHPLLAGAMIPTIAKRLSLGEQDAKLLQFLVENHLELSCLFERRDHGEKQALQALAQRVDNPMRLSLLYLLTYADIKASDTWSEWKDSLLWELYKKIAGLLSQQRPEAARPASFKEGLLELARGQGLEQEALRHCELVPPRYALEVSPQEAVSHLEMIRNLKSPSGGPVYLHSSESDHLTDIWVCTRDMPARFTQLSGVFTAKGLDIISAQAYTRKDGVILDRFRIAGPEGKSLKDKGIKELQQDLSAVLTGQLSLVELLHSRQRRVAPSHPPAPGPTRIYIDNNSSPDYTIIDVVSPDRVGLLYAISKCLADCGLDIHFAKVATKLHLAIDVFYVTLKDARTKLFDEEDLKRVKQQLMEACTASGE
ncbi:MAG TPA: [protein-PII] uridylyltransferase [Candidatus Tripitaka sp. YC43]